MQLLASTLCVTLLFRIVLSDDEEDTVLSQKCGVLIPGCECYDFGDISGVRCWNATEFFATRHLLDGSIFEVNTTFEITVEGGIKILPPKILEGLIVFRLALDDPEIDGIDPKAFDALLRLRRFHVRLSSIKRLPDFRPIRHSLRNINLDNSLLTSLEGDGLKGLPLLETISFFNNSIQQVDPDVFQGTDNIVIFDMSYNKIPSLPPHLFDSWKKLRKVALSHNHLLHVDHLFAVARPFFIFLDFNNLTEVDSILPLKMTNLTTILLASNPIEQITATSFNGKTPDLKFLHLDHCKIRAFDVSHYQSLQNLNTLDLSYNEIEVIPNQNINFGKSLELVLEGNRIKEFQAEMSFTVKRAYLANNQLRSLGKTLQYTQLTEVSVARNELQQLRNEDFLSVHGLSILILNDNQLKWIDQLAFFNIRNDLHNLDLSCNHLTSLNGSVMLLSQLKYLNLTSNLITIFEDGEFTGLNELSELYLHDNRIMALGGQLQQLSRLQFLVVSNNEIQTISMNQIPKSLQYLYIKGNPIRCDCRLYPFIQWLHLIDSPGTDISICIGHNNSYGNPCPAECNCSCARGINEFFIALDCSFRNLTNLPLILTSNQNQSFKQDTPFVKIHVMDFPIGSKLLSDGNVEITDTIGEINLSNNSLVSLSEVRLPSDLKRLYLQNNKLTEVSSDMLNEMPGLQRVSLSGNPWKCDCDAVGFRKWILSKEEIITDVNMTRCGSDDAEMSDRFIWTLDDRDLCPTSIGLIFSLSFGIIAFFLGITVSKILYTRYELYIKVWLYSHGVTWVKEKDIDKDKHFDAFISFSHIDQDFVINQIISVIEIKEPKVRLCLHYKHFTPGEYIHDNIMNAVQNSKRTILVLSRNFLESEWCLMEFRAAHVQALKDRVHRIIIIKVGELPKEIDPSIKLYLDSTTYLTWGEKYFWNNLLYVLPTSGNTRTPVFALENHAFKDELA